MRSMGLCLALAAVLIDQTTKAWALDALWPPYSPGIPVLPGFDLRLGFNIGVTFGLFAQSAAGAVWLLVAVTFAVVVALAVWLWRTHLRLEAFGLGLVIGGACGNIVDRLRLGAVVDFLDLHYAGWHWPTFNLADVAIVCGVAALLLAATRPATTHAQHITGRSDA